MLAEGIANDLRASWNKSKTSWLTCKQVLCVRSNRHPLCRRDHRAGRWE
jgi:hypothetical protein